MIEKDFELYPFSAIKGIKPEDVDPLQKHLVCVQGYLREAHRKTLHDSMDPWCWHMSVVVAERNPEDTAEKLCSQCSHRLLLALGKTLDGCLACQRTDFKPRDE